MASLDCGVRVQLIPHRRENLTFLHKTAADEHVVVDHDSGSHRQAETFVRLGVKLLAGFGDDLRFHAVKPAQPGQHGQIVLSGLAPGFIQKKTHLDHDHSSRESVLSS